MKLTPFLFSSFYQFSILVILILLHEFDVQISYPELWIYAALFTNEGKGRGNIKLMPRFYGEKSDLYGALQSHPQFARHVQMPVWLFDKLLNEMAQQKKQLVTNSKVKYVIVCL